MTVPRKPGWFHTMEHPWATHKYDFPANPVKGNEHVASDGSRWEFNVHGQGFWDLMNYSPECPSPGCKNPTEGGRYCPDCVHHGHDLGVHF